MLVNKGLESGDGEGYTGQRLGNVGGLGNPGKATISLSNGLVYPHNDNSKMICNFCHRSMGQMFYLGGFCSLFAGSNKFSILFVHTISGLHDHCSKDFQH